MALVSVLLESEEEENIEEGENWERKEHTKVTKVAKEGGSDNNPEANPHGCSNASRWLSKALLFWIEYWYERYQGC